MALSNIMLMLSSFLIGNSLLFAAYLFLKQVPRKKQGVLNKILGFLLLAFAVRIAKSLIYIVFPEYADVLTKIGIVGMLAMGPLLLAYCKILYGSKALRRYHFYPTVLLLLGLPWIQGSTIPLVYFASLAHILLYLMGTMFFVGKRIPNIKLNTHFYKSWIVQLFAGMWLLWIGFVLQAFIADKSVYIGVTFSEVIVFFLISLSAMLHIRKIWQPLHGSEVPAESVFYLAQNAHTLLQKEGLYLNSNLSLEFLAKRLGANRHELSNALNQGLKKSFPELLNELRIDHAIQILGKDVEKSISVEAIAFESGFNSLSTFYKNFKRQAGVTPAEFRERMSQESA